MTGTIAVKNMTAEQKQAHDRMSVARKQWIATQAISPVTMAVNLERDLQACMLNRVWFSEAEVWYARARTLAAKIADVTGLTLDQVAGVIAVMSPNVPWVTQERWTLTYCEQVLAGIPWKKAKGPGGYNKNRFKAAQIILGGDPHKLCSGPKVYPFMLAILGDESQIVIDVWMARSMLNVDCDQDTAACAINPVKIKAAIKDAIRTIAARYGLTPAVTQAAIWLAVKNRMEADRPTSVSPVTFRFEDYV